MNCLKIKACSHKGSDHAANEDSYAVGSRYVVVSDGMGACAGGREASEIVTATIRNQMEAGCLRLYDFHSEEHLKDKMFEMIWMANDRIRSYVNSHPDAFGMGATVVFALLSAHRVYIAWCGDSAAFICKRDNDGRKLIKLTRDHSYVQELVDANKISEAESFTHPNNNLITRFVGTCSYECLPEFVSYEFKEDDILMLCTDGLSGYCRNDEIADVIKNGSDINRRLVSLAIERGSGDDITVVTLRRRISMRHCLRRILGSFRP